MPRGLGTPKQIPSNTTIGTPRASARAQQVASPNARFKRGAAAPAATPKPKPRVTSGSTPTPKPRTTTTTQGTAMRASMRKKGVYK